MMTGADRFVSISPFPGSVSMAEANPHTHKRRHFSEKVQGISASGIRRFFELIANMDGCISLGVGEPDFVTPERYITGRFRRGDGRGDALHLELRPAGAATRRSPSTCSGCTASATTRSDEIIVTIGVSEALAAGDARAARPGRRGAVAGPVLRRVPALRDARRRQASCRYRRRWRTTSACQPQTSRRGSRRAPRRSCSATRRTPPERR